jgi:hypothetical protein
LRGIQPIHKGKIMRGFYRGLALAVAVLVALQAAFIAFALSGMVKWVRDGGTLDASVFAE